VAIVEGEGAVLGVNVGHPVVTTGDFVAYLCREGWRRGFSQITPRFLVEGRELAAQCNVGKMLRMRHLYSAP